MSTPSTPVPVPVAVGLGSNLGDRARHLVGGVRGLGEGGVEVEAVSSIYESEPVGYVDQGAFLNAVVRGATHLSPGELLALAGALEDAADRRRTIQGGPRTLDVDLILYGEREISSPGLRVPHPRFRGRSFVLAPLAEIAPEWVDPGTGRTVLDLWQDRRGKLPPARLIAPPRALLGSVP